MVAIEELLEQQSVLLDQINSVLKEEFAVLKERQAFSLPEIENKKTSIINKIRALDKTIGEHPDCQLLKTTLKPKKDDILNKLKECQKQNSVNGKLIQMSMAANRRLGATLSQLKDRSSMTYDDKGATHSYASSGIKIEC